MKREFKHQRQLFEYNVSIGRNRINNLITQRLDTVNKENFDTENNCVRNLLKRIKNDYKIKNTSICRMERIWLQRINKLSK